MKEENNCRKCGVEVFNSNILCYHCIEDLSLQKKKDSKKNKLKIIKEKQKWKKEWESINDNWFLEKFSINNPYSGAVLYHFIICIIVLFLPKLLMPVIGIVSILGDTAGQAIITISVIGYFIILFKYMNRLFYFIKIRISKGKPNKR